MPEPEDEEEPAPRSRSLAVWLASGVGTATLVALIAGGTLFALLVLFALRPGVPIVDAGAAKTTVAAMIGQQQYIVDTCAANWPAGRGGSVVMRFDLVAGWPTNVAVESSDTKDAGVDACFVQAIQAMTFGGAPDTPIRLPFRLP